MSGELEKKVGKKIRVFRKEKKLNQKDMAKKVGIGYRTYNFIELGKTPPRINVLGKIGAVLGYSPEEFIYELFSTAEYQSNINVKSLECLLSLDEKGRVVITKDVREILNIDNDTPLILGYRQTEHHTSEEISNLLPVIDYGCLDDMNRFQTSDASRDYLSLKEGDYFIGKIKNLV